LTAIATWFARAGVKRACVASLFGIGAVWLLVRFVGLGTSPPGFWMDEAWAATHALCLAQTGHNGDKVSWPLYSNAIAGGQSPLTLLGFNTLWIGVFGTSRAAFRAASAFWICLTCAGLFWIARSIVSLIPPWHHGPAERSMRKTFPWLVLLAALLSPWGFQYSRIAWEGPLAPAFMVLAMAAMVRIRCRLAHGARWAVAAGLLATCSMISYPALRATVPFVLTMVGLVLLATVERPRMRRLLAWWLLLAASVLALAMLPTLLKLLHHQITGRMEGVAIFTAEWLDHHRGTSGRIPFLLITLLDNLLLHLRPSYLFFTGDPNGRHSPHVVGQLSFLDSLAVAMAAATVAGLLWRLLRQVLGRPTAPIRGISATASVMLAVAGLSILGGAFGTLPAALTHEGLPHSLRAIGAWPFVPLFTGAILALAWAHRSWALPATAAVALLYTAYYLPMYRASYRVLDAGLFHREITESLARDDDGETKLPVVDTLSHHLGHGDEVLRYYLITEGHIGCDRSSEVMKDIREKAKKD
jgi:hypothetical protein